MRKLWSRAVSLFIAIFICSFIYSGCGSKDSVNTHTEDTPDVCIPVVLRGQDTVELNDDNDTSSSKREDTSSFNMFDSSISSIQDTEVDTETDIFNTDNTLPVYQNTDTESEIIVYETIEDIPVLNDEHNVNSAINNSNNNKDEISTSLDEPIEDSESSINIDTDIDTDTKNENTISTSPLVYTPSDFQFSGVINWGGWRWTWYSQRVLPGGGLVIPGRHVDANGYVCDENDYICLAATSLSKGTIVDTPFGKQGKVYDSGCAYGTLDVYVNW